MKKLSSKSAAIVTIFDAPEMSRKGRNAVADWMERQAGFLRSNAKQLSNRFRARYLYGLLAAVLVLCGCAGTGGNQPIQQTVYTLAVSTGVSLESAKHPEAVPYVRAANQIICTSADGTNVSPAEIVAAIQNSPAAQAAATDTGKLIVNGVIVLYSALFEGGGLNNEEARLWLGYTCEAITLGLPPINAVPSRAMSPRRLPPQLR